MKIVKCWTKLLFVLLLFVGQVFGWGSTGHKIINGNFTKFLPPALSYLSNRTSYFVAHASVADNRKSWDPTESPKHFIDIDAYPEFAAGNLTHSYDSLCAEYGKSAVINNGTLPWTISACYDTLVTFFADHDSVNADRIIADLGHYVGDGFQPLHCTENYDGKMTGNSGIHSRFETTLLEKYQSDIVMDSATVGRIDTSALEFAFRIIYHSNSLVQAILDADTYAKGLDSKYGSTYYAALWSRLDTLMNEQLQGAAESLASLVYSAYLDAGFVPTLYHEAAQMPTSFFVSPAYPNPFNPATSFNITVPGSANGEPASISIYNVAGQLVSRFDRVLTAGSNTVQLNFSAFPSGVYFVSVGLRRQPRQFYTFKAVLLK